MSDCQDNSLSYDDAALSIRHTFYDKRFMLYVEGVDDIPFWNIYFSRYLPSGVDYEIQEVGGKEQLKILIEKVTNGSVQNTVIARDSDYEYGFNSTLSEHDLVVRTFGHSIENTMFCPQSIANCLKIICRTSRDFSSDVRDWLVDFISKASSLLPYEIAKNHLTKSSENLPLVFGRSFFLFLMMEQ